VDFFLERVPRFLEFNEDVVLKNTKLHLQTIYSLLDQSTVQSCEESLISHLLENIETLPGEGFYQRIKVLDEFKQDSEGLIRIPLSNEKQGDSI
jgi:hypothetical protein